MKYNQNHKHRKWIRTIALEAETALTQLLLFEQNGWNKNPFYF